MLHCGYYARHKCVDALGGVPYQSRLSFLGTARQVAECATITAFQGAAITSSAAERRVHSQLETLFRDERVMLRGTRFRGLLYC